MARLRTHDGGYSHEEYARYARIRERIREAEKANAREREKRRRRLADELDKAYRRVVLKEPEVALEIAQAIVPEAVAASEPDELPVINWTGLSDLLARAGEVLAILEHDRAEAAWLAGDDDDIEILLLAA